MARIVGFTVILTVAIFVALQLPLVQTRLATFASEKASEALNAGITLEKICIMPFNTVIIKNLCIVDKAPYTEDIHSRGWDPVDTLAKVKTISAAFSLKGLIKKEGLHILRARVEEGYLHIASEPGEKYKSNIERVFRLTKKDEKNMGELFRIDKANITSFRFRLNSFLEKTQKNQEACINFSDMDVTTNIMASGIRMSGGKMSGTVEHLDAYEKSGFRLDGLSAYAIVGGGRAIVENLRIFEGRSNISLKMFSMTFTTTPPFKDLVDSVIFEALFNSSTIDVRTISSVCGALDGNDLCFDVSSGHVKGSVNHLNVENLVFRERVSGMKAKVSTLLIGTTDIVSSTLVAHVRDATFTSEGLTAFLARWAASKPDLSKLACKQTLLANADVRGRLNNMEASCEIQSSFGSAKASLKFSDLLVRERQIRMKGTVNTESMNLGTLLGNDVLGKCTMRARIDAGLGSRGLQAEMDTVVISSLECLRHDYRNIKGTLSYMDEFLKGKITCEENSLSMSLNSNIYVGGERKLGPGKLTLDLPYADLKGLGFYDKDEGAAKLGCKIDLAMTSGLNGDGQSAIRIMNLRLDDSKGWKRYDDVTIGADITSNEKRLVMYSEFCNAMFRGKGSIRDFISTAKYGIAGKSLPALTGVSEDIVTPSPCELKIILHNTVPILKLIKPDLYVASGTELNLKIDENGLMKAGVSSPRIAIKTNNAKNLSITMNSSDDTLRCGINASSVKLAGLSTFVMNGDISALHDSVSMKIDMLSDSEREFSGKLIAGCKMRRDSSGQFIARIEPTGTEMDFKNYDWRINPSAVEFCGKTISFEGLRIGYDDTHFFDLDGGVRAGQPDTLKMDVSNIELALVEELLQKNLELKGNLSGHGILYSPLDGNFGLQMKLRCDSLSAGGSKVSTLTASSIWNESSKSMDIDIEDRTEDGAPLLVSGSYSPGQKVVSAKASFDNFDMRCCKNLLENVLSNIDGHLSGNLTADGPLDSLSIISDNLRLDEAKIKVAFTNVAYTANGPLELDSRRIRIDGLKLVDDYGGSALLEGGITHDRFRDFRLGCGLYADRLKILDIQENQAKGLYGNLSISGLAEMSGALNDIIIDADVSTSGQGDIHVPLPSSLSASTSDLLTFVREKQKRDPYEEMMESLKEAEKKASNLTIHSNFKISPEVETTIEIDKESGHVLTASGRGDITLDLKPSKDRFNLDGDYEIGKGSYHFEVPGIVSRDFSITQGSSLNFAGNVSNTTFNINATHNVKTTLSTLLADSTAQSRRNVVCGINIFGKLSKPEIEFSVSVPDLDPSTKVQMDAALNTEDKMQKQFMALLLLGTFVPSEQSGVVNGSNMIYSNVSEIMSSQVNNILGKLGIPVDFGFGYQQTTQGGNMFDVAVSTQLFNNRVEVSGTVGNKNYSTQGSSKGEVVGDLDIEIKIDPQGQFRGKLFSHSADEHSSYLDNAQRNGVGFAYQKEYDSFKELFESIFHPKARQEKEKMNLNRKNDKIIRITK